MLARSNLIYAVICNMLGNREGTVGAAYPNFGAVCTVPPTVSPSIEVSTFYIFVSFLSPQPEDSSRATEGNC